jgi:hypothetical protein
VFCGRTFFCYFSVVPDHCIPDSFFFFGTVHVDFGCGVCIFTHMRAVTLQKRSLLAPRPILHNSKSYCGLVVFIHGGLIYCGVFSILLGSNCKFPNDFDALTNRGLGVAGLYAYSFVLFGSTQICDDQNSCFHVV